MHYTPAFTSCSSCSSWNRNSVWPDLAKFRHFGIVSESLSNIWPNFESSLAKFVCFWSNLFCCKWPSLINNLTIWSHCRNYPPNRSPFSCIQSDVQVHLPSLWFLMESPMLMDPHLCQQQERSPTCSLTTTTGSNRVLDKVYTYFTKEIRGGWGANRCPHVFDSCFIWTPHYDQV